MNRMPFDKWAAEQLDVSREVLVKTKVIAAFDLLVSRLEAASTHGAANPLVTITGKRAGGNSRACTRRMLEQLGFTPQQRRAVHRLLAGSTSGWPGLLRLYADCDDLGPRQRQYARRQLSTLDAASRSLAAPAGPGMTLDTDPEAGQEGAGCERDCPAPAAMESVTE